MLLKKIPKDVQALLSASARINSYRKAIEELVYNALDAESSSIAIRVDTEECSLQIIDNGHGISRYDFDVLGQRHMTSKYVDISTLKSPPNKYGMRGEALANIIEISQSVKIISRLENTDETWIKIFCNGKQKNLKKYTTRASKGTTVEIKGFMHNLRIRKHALDPLNELQEIKAFMEQLSLTHINISLSLRDDSKNEIVFQLHKKRDVYQTLSSLFNIEKTDVQELKVEKKNYKVTAFIGNDDREDGKHWIFLNRKFVRGNSRLHKIINDNMTKNIKDRVTNFKSKNRHDVGEENYVLISKKIPFYFLWITCPYIDYDISNTPNQTFLEFGNWEQVSKLLEKLVHFYIGDVKFKKINKTDYHNKYNKDTKTEVKNIIDRFLASQSRKLRVSQVHNGVKGKLIKRKNKKQLRTPFTILKLPKKSKHNTENIGVETIKPEISNKIQLNKHTADKKLNHEIVKQKSNNQKEHNAAMEIWHTSKEIKKKSGNKNTYCKSKLNNNKPLIGKRVSEIRKILITKDPQIKKSNKLRKRNDIMRSRLIEDPVLDRLANPTNSIKSRLPLISEKADHVLKNLSIKRKQEAYINECIEHSSITKDNKNISIRKRREEIVVYNYLPVAPKTNKFNNISDFKSTYDLIQTIIKTQQETLGEPNILFSKINKSVNLHKLRESVLPKTFENAPMSILTFDSHKNVKYNNNSAMKKKSVAINEKRYRNIKFMTKRTIDNFNDSNNRYYPIYPNKKNINIRNSKPFNAICKKKPKTTLHNNNNVMYADDSPYIDFTKSEKNTLCNREHNLVVNSEILPHNDISRYDELRCIDSSPKINQNVNVADNGQNIFSQNTYTIARSANTNFEMSEHLHSPHKANVVRDSYDQYSDCQLTHNVIYRDTMEREIFSQQRDNSNVIVECHSQDSKAMKVNDDEIEPLNMCNVIISSDDMFENEFNFSFYASNKLNGSLLNVDVIKNNDQEIVNNYHENSNIIEPQENLSRHFNKLDKSNNDVASKHNSKMQNLIAKSNPNQISECVIDNFNKDQLPDIESNRNIKATEFGNFDLKNRLRFMPKGMSPIFDKCNSKAGCNYNSDRDYYEDNLYIDFVNHVQMNSEVFESKIQDVKGDNKEDINKTNSRMKKDDASLKFDGQSLKTAKVLGQVDDKFIAAIIKGRPNQNDVASEFLVLFDQHAVHERVRLEKNLSDYLYNDQWKSVAVDSVSMKMSKDVVLYLHNYKDKFTQLGLQWTVENNEDIAITAIPEAIIGKKPRQVEKIMQSVKNLIAEEIKIIKLQRGCVSMYPKAIMDLVFSEACRYAIKFGDKLTRNNCVELLNSLSECKTPFQCAHGRPVMAVLIDNISTAREYKVNLTKIYDFKTKFCRLTKKQTTK